MPTRMSGGVAGEQRCAAAPYGDFNHGCASPQPLFLKKKYFLSNLPHQLHQSSRGGVLGDVVVLLGQLVVVERNSPRLVEASQIARMIVLNIEDLDHDAAESHLWTVVAKWRGREDRKINLPQLYVR